MSTGSPRLRLFYALWPSESQRQALLALMADALESIEGMTVQPSNLHVTLAFLGDTRGSRFPDLVKLGGQVDRPGVTLGFNRLVYWPKPRVVVALPARSPQAGQQLVDALWAGLEPLGFRREARPWQPHLTVVRHVRRPPAPSFGPELPAKTAAIAAAGWGLALVESTTHPEGARYRPVAEWPLI